MDLTGWLEYFIAGLSTQLEEVKERGRRVIRADVLVHDRELNDRQRVVLLQLAEESPLNIQDLERLLPQVHRRTLQRDLKQMIDAGLVVSEGSTNRLVYRLGQAF
jgi:hypothetical protein